MVAFRFSWNCTSKPTHATCFKNDGAFKNLNFIIRDFNLSDFKDDGSPYEFKLLVSDNVTDKQRSNHAVQMVYVDANSYGE